MIVKYDQSMVNIGYLIGLLWETRCLKPIMTGEGWNPIQKHGNDLGMAYYLVYHHYLIYEFKENTYNNRYIYI
jgi:hypothetical protein